MYYLMNFQIRVSFEQYDKLYHDEKFKNQYILYIMKYK